MLAYKANKIANSNFELAKQENKNRIYRINKDERKIFNSVYTKITQGIGLVLRDGRVCDDAQALFWKARDEARLQLPDDIVNYTQVLFDKMHTAYLLKIELDERGSDGSPILRDRKESAKKHMQLISELIKEEPYKIFACHMKVKTS